MYCTCLDVWACAGSRLIIVTQFVRNSELRWTVSATAPQCCASSTAAVPAAASSAVPVLPAGNCDTNLEQSDEECFGYAVINVRTLNVTIALGSAAQDSREVYRSSSLRVQICTTKPLPCADCTVFSKLKPRGSCTARSGPAILSTQRSHKPCALEGPTAPHTPRCTSRQIDEQPQLRSLSPSVINLARKLRLAVLKASHLVIVTSRKVTFDLLTSHHLVDGHQSLQPPTFPHQSPGSTNQLFLPWVSFESLPLASPRLRSPYHHVIQPFVAWTA
jgi:hypothetical protein